MASEPIKTITIEIIIAKTGLCINLLNMSFFDFKDSVIPHTALNETIRIQAALI
ncbi:hypothetical protein D3C84_855730 [compost metagenome]